MKEKNISSVLLDAGYLDIYPPPGPPRQSPDPGFTLAVPGPRVHTGSPRTQGPH